MCGPTPRSLTFGEDFRRRVLPYGARSRSGVPLLHRNGWPKRPKADLVEAFRRPVSEPKP